LPVDEACSPPPADCFEAAALPTSFFLLAPQPNVDYKTKIKKKKKKKIWCFFVLGFFWWPTLSAFGDREIFLFVFVFVFRFRCGFFSPLSIFRVSALLFFWCGYPNLLSPYFL
jgi:hypothetical protein